MIGQPLGCILAFLIGVFSIVIAVGIIWCANLAFGWSGLAFIWVPAVAVIPFSLLLDLGHRLEIRYFFKKRQVRLARIRGFRNHYRVDYVQDGRKMSGKWPKDFESWVTKTSL